MPFDDFLTYREAHSSSLVLTALPMKPLKRGENLIEILLFEPDAIVFNRDFTFLIVVTHFN